MKHWKKTLALALSTALFVGCVAGCGAKPGDDAQGGDADGEVLKMRYALTNSTESNSYRMAVKFAETVEELSEGSMTVQVLPQYSGERDLIESVQRGDLEFTYTSAAPLVSFVPEMAVFDVPFLFQTKEDLDATIKNACTVFDNEDVKAATLDKMDGVGLHGIGFWSKGFRVLATDKAINTLEDLKGLKLRTMENSNHIEAWKALGANPTPMAFNDVYTSLEQGTIEGQEQPFDVLASNKFYEVQGYATSVNMIIDACVFMSCKEFYDGLSDEQRAIIDEASAVAIEFARQDALDGVNKDIQTLKDGGMEVNDFDTAQREKAIELTKPIEDAIRAEIGDEVVNLFYDAQS